LDSYIRAILKILARRIDPPTAKLWDILEELEKKERGKP